MSLCRLAFLFTASWMLLLLVFPANGQEFKRPPIKGIAFVRLQVSNSKKATGFYQDVLGWQVPAAKPMNANKHHYHRIMVNQRQSVILQDGLPATQDERLLSLAFETSDAAAMRAYLQSKLPAVPASLSKEDGVLFFTVTDPDQHNIQFVEYTHVAKTATTASENAISKRILHAGLTIANAGAANQFYGDILGFTEIWRGGSTDTATSWINMRVPEGTDYLEYMLVNGPANRQQLGSMHHIALLVPDMQAAVDLLDQRTRTNGYQVVAPRIGRNNRWQLNLFDPDGTRVELMEPFPMR